MFENFRIFLTPDSNFSCGYWLFCASKVLFFYILSQCMVKKACSDIYVLNIGWLVLKKQCLEYCSTWSSITQGKAGIIQWHWARAL